ncbi:hypothetical protein D3C78_1564260 [compost metagenome]
MPEDAVQVTLADFDTAFKLIKDAQEQEEYTIADLKAENQLLNQAIADLTMTMSSIIQ